MEYYFIFEDMIILCKWIAFFNWLKVSLSHIKNGTRKNHVKWVSRNFDMHDVFLESREYREN